MDKGILDPYYSATARLSTTAAISGVPVGSHTDWPVAKAIGCPCETTRFAPFSHRPLTHGPVPAVNPQPLTI